MKRSSLALGIIVGCLLLIGPRSYAKCDDVAVGEREPAPDDATLQDLAKKAADQANWGSQEKQRVDSLATIGKALRKLLGEASVLTPRDVALKLQAGLQEACKQFDDGQSEQIAQAKAFDAAGLKIPEGIRVLGTTGGDSEYLLLAGNVNSLEANGGWRSNVEVAFQSRTKWLDVSGKLFKVDLSDTKLLSSFDVVYAKIGALQKGEGSQDVQGTEVGSSTNPFTSDSGILRINGAAEYMLTHNFGVSAGAGLTTFTSSKDSTSADLRSRLFGGLLFVANYGTTQADLEENRQKATGRVVIAYAKDKFWDWDEVVAVGDTTTVIQRSSHNRWVADARLDLPAFTQGKSMRLAVRLFADAPTNGRGPSDVRISLLLNVDIEKFLK